VPISYNTGVVNTADASSNVTLALPAGILVGDVMVMSLTCFNENATPPTITFSGAGGSWTLVPVTVGSNPEISSGGGNYSYGYAYYRVATAGDQGATLTITGSGSGFFAGTTWWAAAVASYTTVNTTTPIDVAGGATAFTIGALNFSVTCPSLATNCTADMGVYLGSGAPGIGGAYYVPDLTTPRSVVNSDVGIGVAISDSNGFAGFSVGGGAFSTNNQGIAWLTGFTVGLAPADGGGNGIRITGYRAN